ncbi:MAG: YaiI/YqxD family protein [Burkholderiales bacterium]|nr:YaiI/YqxD family protein [Burkholderiales bacterium]
MHIWVDADACPGAAKEILYRAADRLRIGMTLVANQALATPRSRFIKTLQVEKGMDAADHRIVAGLAHGDLVITADLPLAAAAIEKGARVLSPRGEILSRDNIGPLLSMRNFMDELRSGGVTTGGPAAYGHADRQAFANSLDRLLPRIPLNAP